MAVYLLLSAHRAVIFAIAQLSCFPLFDIFNVFVIFSTFFTSTAYTRASLER